MSVIRKLIYEEKTRRFEAKTLWVTKIILPLAGSGFRRSDWLFELKHDGFRSLAYLEDGRCRLVSRRRNTYKSFEVLRSALEGLRAQSAILDGEIVALDSSGVSQFKKSCCIGEAAPSFSPLICFG